MGDVYLFFSVLFLRDNKKKKKRKREKEGQGALGCT